MDEHLTGSSSGERPSRGKPSGGCGSRPPGGELLLLPLLLLSFLAFSPALGTYYRLDDIDILFGASRVGKEVSLFRWLLVPHNEHLVPIAKIQFYSFWRIFDIRAHPFLFFVVLEILAIQYLLWRLSARWFRTTAARLALVGLFGTTGLYVECAVWPLAGGFFTALILSLAALFGVDRFLEKGSKTGLLLSLGGSLLAPMGSLAGAPTGGWVLLYALMGGGRGADSPLRRRLIPAAAGFLGMAGYLALYFSFARVILQPGVFEGREALAVNIPGGVHLTALALVTQQWARLVVFPAGILLTISVVAAFVLRRGGLRRHLLMGFLAWSAGNLLFVFLFRSFAGPESIEWGRYHLYATAGTAALAGLALDQVLSGWRGRKDSRLLRGGLVCVGILVLLLNAAVTARAVSERARETDTLRRFCREWRRVPEAYSGSGREKPMQIPDVEVRLPQAPRRRLSALASICWPREREWDVVWTKPGTGLSGSFRGFLEASDEFPTVREALELSAPPPARRSPHLP